MTRVRHILLLFTALTASSVFAGSINAIDAKRMGNSLQRYMKVDGFKVMIVTVARLNNAMRIAAQNPLDQPSRQAVGQAFVALPVAIAGLAKEFEAGKLVNSDLPAVQAMLGGFMDSNALAGYESFMKKPDASLIPSVGAEFPQEYLQDNGSAGSNNSSHSYDDSHLEEKVGANKRKKKNQEFADLSGYTTKAPVFAEEGAARSAATLETLTEVSLTASKLIASTEAAAPTATDAQPVEAPAPEAAPVSDVTRVAREAAEAIKGGSLGAVIRKVASSTDELWQDLLSAQGLLGEDEEEDSFFGGESEDGTFKLTENEEELVDEEGEDEEGEEELVDGKKKKKKKKRAKLSEYRLEAKPKFFRFHAGVLKMLAPKEARAESGQALFGASAVLSSVLLPIAGASPSYEQSRVQIGSALIGADLQRDLTLQQTRTQALLSSNQVLMNSMNNATFERVNAANNQASLEGTRLAIAASERQQAFLMQERLKSASIENGLFQMQVYITALAAQVQRQNQIFNIQMSQLNIRNGVGEIPTQPARLTVRALNSGARDINGPAPATPVYTNDLFNARSNPQTRTQFGVTRSRSLPSINRRAVSPARHGSSSSRATQQRRTRRPFAR